MADVSDYRADQETLWLTFLAPHRVKLRDVAPVEEGTGQFWRKRFGAASWPGLVLAGAPESDEGFVCSLWLQSVADRAALPSVRNRPPRASDGGLDACPGERRTVGRLAADRGRAGTGADRLIASPICGAWSAPTKCCGVQNLLGGLARAANAWECWHASSMTCGLITGAVAGASVMSPGPSAARALGGGLAPPLLHR